MLGFNKLVANCDVYRRVSINFFLHNKCESKSPDQTKWTNKTFNHVSQFEKYLNRELPEDYHKGIGGQTFGKKVFASVCGLVIRDPLLSRVPLLSNNVFLEPRMLPLAVCNNRHLSTKTCPPRRKCYQPTEKSLFKTALLLTFTIITSSFILYKAWKRSGETKEVKEEVIVDSGKTPRKPKIREIIKNPQTSSQIPNDVPYVLVGGGTASFSAFKAIAKKDPSAKVLILSKESNLPYLRPPLSTEMVSSTNRELARKLEFTAPSGLEKSIFFETEEFFTPCSELLDSEGGGVSIALGWSVKSIDPQKKEITLEDNKRIKYGKCLLATGASPTEFPPFDDMQEQLEGRVSYYRTIADFEDVDDVITEGVNSIVIYGGGFLGCELACSFNTRAKKSDLEVTQIVRSSGLMEEILPSYLSQWLKTKIESQGVKLVNNTEISDIDIRQGKLEITFSNNEKISTDHLIVCVGATPNTKMAKISGLEVDKVHGGFLANAELQIRTDLYTAGDCASYLDPKVYQRRLITHHDNAVLSGRLAGENMAGGRKTLTQQPVFGSHLGRSLGYEAVGLVHSRLSTVGIFSTRAKNQAGLDTKTSSQEIDYSRGVIFYLKENIVVGILLWNLFNRIPTAKVVLSRHVKYDDINEVSKMFKIHED